MGEEGGGLDAPLLEGLLHDRVGDLLGGAGGDRGLDEHQGLGGDVLGDRHHRGLEGLHVRRPVTAVAEGLLEVVALDVDDHHVGQLQGVVGVGGHERLLLVDAALDHDVHFGILGLDGGEPAVEEMDLPVAAGARALHADDELARLALLVGAVGDDGGHDGADEADADDDDDLAALFALPATIFFRRLNSAL